MRNTYLTNIYYFDLKPHSTMKFLITAALLSLAGLVSAGVASRSFAQVDRFGDVVVTPTTCLHLGDVSIMSLTVKQNTNTS